MLVQLAIRDIVLIDKLELTFSGGLTVLTGETGAGKSILLDAFALALGGRGDGGLWRVGDGHGARGEGLVGAPDLPETGGQHPSATVHIVRPTCRACTINININIILLIISILI